MLPCLCYLCRMVGQRRASTPRRVKVLLCVTCLVDTFYPRVGVATVELLRRLGVDVSFPQEQTCCGQPAYNGGFHREAGAAVLRFLDQFQGEGYVVVPSGSCAAMMKVQYPYLVRNDPELLARATDLAQRTYELSDFLVNVLQVREVGASFAGTVTYHESCHLLRELRISQEPRQLIQSVRRTELVEMPGREVCCGFGGLFSVNHPGISSAMLDDKLAAIESTGADAVVANDMGCLMHMEGAIRRKGMRVRPMHLAELLVQRDGRVTW